ncbi:MAG: hypothetical protein P8Q97_13445 [Myxococcota bacterium]|nr:hypothetical protein [Myxococcota bacterium]
MMKPTRRRNRYQLLNLNQENVPTAGLPQKHATLRDEVVKELRLNFKVPLLHSTFPAMRVLVAIRHPGAQITSILRLFEGGRLAELRAALDEFVETIEEQERFAKYRDTLEAIGEGEASRLVLWWLVNYEVLLEDLAAVGAAHKVVTNEALSVDPAGVVSDVFNFCGITVDEAVTDYVRHSTSGKSETTSAVDTVRDSAPYSEKAIRATTPDLLEEIRAVFERQRDSHGLAPEIEDYLPALAIR